MKKENILINSNSNKILLNKLREESSSNLISGIANINNISNSYLIYKVMFNKNTLYSAAPACSYISPNSSIEILVKRFEDSYMDLKNDLFLIKAYVYTGSEKLKSVSRLYINIS